MLVGAAILVPVLAILGGGVEERLSVGGFIVDNSESEIGDRILEDVFDAGPADWVLVLALNSGTLANDDVAAAGTALTEAIEADPGTTEVLSYWTLEGYNITEVSPLQSVDGRNAVVVASFAGDEDEQRETANRLEAFTEPTDLWTAGATGPVEISRQARENAKNDLLRSELIAAPLTLLALLLVFRGLRPALLPLAVAVFAILGTYTVLSLIAAMTTVSVFALNLTTALGLGLAIDYCLLMVARFREELGRGRPVEQALSHTVANGRANGAVQRRHRGCVTHRAGGVPRAVPAIVRLRRSRCGAGRLRRLGRGVAGRCWPGSAIGSAPAPGTRSRLLGASSPASHPPSRHAGHWPSRTILVFAGLPFLRFDAGRIDDRVLPPSNSARIATDQLNDFAFRNFNGLGVIAIGADHRRGDDAASSWTRSSPSPTSYPRRHAGRASSSRTTRRERPRRRSRSTSGSPATKACGCRSSAIASPTTHEPSSSCTTSDNSKAPTPEWI